MFIFVELQLCACLEARSPDQLQSSVASSLLPNANEVWGKVMFHGGVSPTPPINTDPPSWADLPGCRPPWGWADTPWMQTLWGWADPSPGWADRSWTQTPVRLGTPPPPGVGQIPPIQSTSGRYAFYWNSYLFPHIFTWNEDQNS